MVYSMLELGAIEDLRCASQPTVVITGAAGYIGSHVVNLFLQDGGYHVIGTVRDKSNKKKILPLRQALGPNFDRLELRDAELLDPASLDAAIKGADYLVHVASPYILEEPTHEDDIIKPAVEGTIAALRVAHKHRVKRVIVTSSIASVSYKHDGKGPFNEENWTDLDVCTELKDTYFKSKTMAEKVAWDFQASLPTTERFELVTLCPGLVMGPSFVQGVFASGDILNRMMNGSLGSHASDIMPLVDVREVAVAHLNAVKIAEAAN